jgi:hypothetical protein
MKRRNESSDQVEAVVQVGVDVQRAPPPGATGASMIAGCPGWSARMTMRESKNQ